PAGGAGRPSRAAMLASTNASVVRRSVRRVPWFRIWSRTKRSKESFIDWAWAASKEGKNAGSLSADETCTVPVHSRKKRAREVFARDEARSRVAWASIVAGSVRLGAA